MKIIRASKYNKLDEEDRQAMKKEGISTYNQNNVISMGYKYQIRVRR